ncbi:MAG: BamA/TamA family outer membrane protein [Gemmatimonadetes bacterium]|nr:BamA/TamA family outer membrane protein [Gemmatimonadota bacterium]
MKLPIPRPSTRSARALALVAAALFARTLAAQDAPECPDGRISQVFVDNRSVFDSEAGKRDSRFAWAFRLANRAHIRTREEVIRRELLFEEGSCYDPALLLDSERILRSTSFIADADVFAVRQPDGTTHVVVETRDEWSTRLEPQVESGEVGLRGLELLEDNLLGRGQRVSAFIKERQGERVFGASFATRQLFGTHADADLSLSRTPVGFAVQQRLAWPFRGEAGRFAFRQQVEHEENNFEFWVPDADGRPRRFLFPEERRTFDVGTVFRLGQRGNLTLFGVALAGDWTVYPRDSLTSSQGNPITIPLPGGGQVFGLDSVSSMRLVFLAGQRNVWFERRRSLDAVRGAEDVRLGVEAEVGIGRSLSALSSDDDLAVDVGFFAAGELPGGVLAGVRLVGEGRRDYAAPVGSFEWRNLFAQADGWAYWRPGPDSRYTWVASALMDGGWRTTVPFQLTLGSRAGLRGYRPHAFMGERRAVATLEHRAYLGWPYPHLFDLGSAAFVDVGKIWQGGDLYGRESPVQASAGVGLRVAFPPGSRRTYRLDIAAPVAPSFQPGRIQVSLGIGQAVGRSAVDDHPQIRRSSRRALSASLFSFPN